MFFLTNIDQSITIDLIMSHELIACDDVTCNFTVETDGYVLKDCQKGLYARGLASLYGGISFNQWPTEISTVLTHHRKLHHRNFTVSRLGKKIGDIYVSEATISYKKLQ